VNQILSDKILDNVFLNAPIGIISVDANFIINSANETTLQFELVNANTVADLIGLHLDSFSVFNTETFKNYLNELKNGNPFEAELSNKLTLDGNGITVILKAIPQFENNIFSGAIFVIEDFKIPLSLTNTKVFENDLFNYFLQSISDYFVITNIKGEIIYSPPIDKLKSNSKIFSKNLKSIENIFGEEYKEVISKLFSESISTKESVFSQGINSNIDNSQSFQLNIIPILDKLKKVNYVFILLENITDTFNKIKNLENEAKELRTYQSIASTVLDAIIAFDQKGQITFWNNSATRVFGYSKIETFGKFIGNIIEDFNIDYFNKIVESLKEDNLFETKVQFKVNNIVRIVSIKMSLSEDEESQSVVALCSNITEREYLEKALRNSEETFRNIVTNTREFLCTFTLEGKITYCNPSFINEFGYADYELLNKEIFMLIDLDAPANINFDFNRSIEKDDEKIELTLLKKNGEKVLVLANFTSVLDLQGIPRYHIGVFTNISEKKKNEQELNLIRSIFETASEGIILTQNGNITLANIAFANLFGYDTIDEIMNFDALDFISLKDKQRAEEDYFSYINENNQTKSIYEGIKKNGDLITIEKGIKKFIAVNAEYIIESYIDITEQQKAKIALEASEERYRSITENINDAIWTVEYNNGSSNLFVSPSIFEITKYNDSEFVNNSKLWIRMIHPDDKESTIAKLKRVYKDRVRKQVELEYRILDKQGSLVWVRNKLNFVRNEFGKIEKIFGLLSDITLNKKNEEKILKTTQALKALNDSKDKFISIVSHDLRTPFSSILGFTDLLLTDDDISSEKQRQYIGFIQESAQNMLKLVNSILDWTRMQTGRIEYIAERLEVQSVVNNAIKMLSGNALKKNIKLYSTIDQEVFVHGDRNLLLQAFNNLISNSIKFTKPEGEVFISAEPLMDKKVIQFSVNDTGIGISDKDIGKLFSVESKHTTVGTKGEKGSGLGLSLVKEIIQMHGGEISVESSPNTGTSFIFTIPISSTKILLIDDANSDVVLYKKLLNNIMPNYQVEVAYDGNEGFDAVQKIMPALIITDHNMPKMSGFDLVKKIIASDIKYKPPIIVLSSDLTDSISKEYEDLGIEYTFKKPVGLTVFKNAIEKSLQKALTT